MAMGMPMANAINIAATGAHMGTADTFLTSWPSHSYLSNSGIL